MKSTAVETLRNFFYQKIIFPLCPSSVRWPLYTFTTLFPTRVRTECGGDRSHRYDYTNFWNPIYYFFFHFLETYTRGIYLYAIGIPQVRFIWKPPWAEIKNGRGRSYRKIVFYTRRAIIYYIIKYVPQHKSYTISERFCQTIYKIYIYDGVTYAAAAEAHNNYRVFKT